MSELEDLLKWLKEQSGYKLERSLGESQLMYIHRQNVYQSALDEVIYEVEYRIKIR